MVDKDHGPILAAVDFSDDSRAALEWAAHYADLIAVPLCVVHIVHDPADAPGYYGGENADTLRPMEDVAAEYLDKFLRAAKKANPSSKSLRSVQSILIRGLPPTRILEVAEEYHAQHIVIGSRGRTGIAHIMLGSNAQRVVQLSSLPVTVIKT